MAVCTFTFLENDPETAGMNLSPFSAKEHTPTHTQNQSQPGTNPPQSALSAVMGNNALYCLCSQRPRLTVSFSTKHHHCRSNPPWLASVPNEANLIAKLTKGVSTRMKQRDIDRNGGPRT